MSEQTYRARRVYLGILPRSPGTEQVQPPSLASEEPASEGLPLLSAGAFPRTRWPAQPSEHVQKGAAPASLLHADTGSQCANSGVCISVHWKRACFPNNVTL